MWDDGCCGLEQIYQAVVATVNRYSPFGGVFPSADQGNPYIYIYISSICMYITISVRTHSLPISKMRPSVLLYVYRNPMYLSQEEHADDGMQKPDQIEIRHTTTKQGVYQKSSTSPHAFH